jgi:hypothetical protein
MSTKTLLPTELPKMMNTIAREQPTSASVIPKPGQNQYIKSLKGSRLA